jgi:hypothetical protein
MYVEASKLLSANSDSLSYALEIYPTVCIACRSWNISTDFWIILKLILKGRRILVASAHGLKAAFGKGNINSYEDPGICPI